MSNQKGFSSKDYKGTIIEESLEDNIILNDFNIIGFKITDDVIFSERWHLYTVQVSREEIEQVSKFIKSGWYAHFWKNRNMIVVFKNKIFEFNYNDKASWQPAIEYGLSLNIPKEQLDFLIN